MATPRRSLLGRVLRRTAVAGAIAAIVAAARDWAIRRNDARGTPTHTGDPPD